MQVVIDASCPFFSEEVSNSLIALCTTHMKTFIHNAATHAGKQRCRQKRIMAKSVPEERVVQA